MRSEERDSKINFIAIIQTVLATIAALFIVFLWGFFLDFDKVKSEVRMLKRDIQQIDELKSIQCEVALYLFKGDNEVVLRHCGKRN